MRTKAEKKLARSDANPLAPSISLQQECRDSRPHRCPSRGPRLPRANGLLTLAPKRDNRR